MVLIYVILIEYKTMKINDLDFELWYHPYANGEMTRSELLSKLADYIKYIPITTIIYIDECLINNEGLISGFRIDSEYYVSVFVKYIVNIEFVSKYCANDSNNINTCMHINCAANSIINVDNMIKVDMPIGEEHMKYNKYERCDLATLVRIEKYIDNYLPTFNNGSYIKHLQKRTILQRIRNFLNNR